MSDLSHLAISGAEFAVKVTPKARRNTVDAAGPVLRIHVTAPPDKGKANDAVVRLLADALGVAKSRLTLIRGATSREKRFRLD